jgi:colanic acid biosynthesis glycosyl transferase WcaI
MPPGLPRTTVILVHDVLVAAASFALAFWLSKGGQVQRLDYEALEYGIPASVLIAAACFYARGLHRRVWSYTSLADLISIARTSTWVILLLFLVVLLVLYRGTEIPGCAPIIQWFVMIVMLSASRLSYRALKDGRLPLRAAPDKVPVLIYGGGPWTWLFVRAAQSTLGVGLQIVGIIDDVDDADGRYFNSIPVLGRASDLERILVGLAVRGVHPRKIIVTRAPGDIAAEARTAMDAAPWRHGLEIEYLPNLLNMGAAATAPLRIGRDPARSSRPRLRRLADSLDSGAALVVLPPVRALIALAALCDRGRRVLFRRPWRGRPMRSGTPSGIAVRGWSGGVRQPPRLLVLNRYFHPDRSATAQLLTDFVETAVKEGFDTTVFAGRQLYNDPGARLPARQSHAGARVRRLWTTRSGRFRLPGRLLDYATFCGSAFFALLSAARPGDVIVAKTDPPLLSVVAWAAASLKRARLVNWCQDLFPEAAAALDLRCVTGRCGRALRALRNASLGGAAINVAVCDSMAARLRAEGIPADLITVIHNWADGARVRPLPREQNQLRRQWRLRDRFVIGYAGNLGRVHEVETLIELIDLLGHDPELVFLLVGAGAGYEWLKRRAGQRRLGNVMLRPYQPPEALREALTAPDLHVVSLRPECEGLVMPSKLYGALAAGRPVLAICDPAGELARIVRAHDAGLVVAPGEAVKAAAAIRALCADRARLAELGSNARAAYERAYNREASLAAWSHCLRTVLAVPHPALQAVAAE